MINYEDLNSTERYFLLKPGDRLCLDKNWFQTFPNSVFSPDKKYEIETINLNLGPQLVSTVKIKGFKGTRGVGWFDCSEIEGELRKRLSEIQLEREREGMTHDQIYRWDNFKTLMSKINNIEEDGIRSCGDFLDPVLLSDDYLLHSKGKRRQRFLLSRGIERINAKMDGACLAPAWLLYPSNYTDILIKRHRAKLEEEDLPQPNSL